MRRIGIALAAALSACTAQPPAPANAPIAEIAGRVAGPAQRCVTIERSEALRAANRSTMIYGSGRTVWINPLESGCSGFRQTDVLVTEPIGSQYCRGDLVRSFDSVSKIPGPACRLGDFIPYTRH